MSFETSAGQDWRWYILQLRPNCLNMAITHLKRQSFQVFNPTHDVPVTRANRFETRREQLFPGYLFVALDPLGTAWRKVNSTRGVARLVSFANRPSPVPSDLMSDLVIRCDSGGRLLPDAELAEGDAVRVRSGPFANFTTMVERIDREKRIWVLLEILGRETRVALRGSELQRA
ncbi:transcription termination/antitermination protein NusG [Celeribacter indicus]|uniref:Transcription termination/antitermination protein NusG n=1 Tax=Celeribacter indicus TaxID=1208324 RepID=A0A0B5E5V3_9RHOB|nr:transcriptional activator RfaH [Celeribacter indicus]AJE48775.1 hypothetical protein P73_4060 [Celeribacter indicus]SDX10879.1 transcriptional antiterminator RfaH [Celeribacter indicus]